MVLHLAEQLEVPLRERNMLLVAAGFAPVFAERPLADPALQAARKAVDLVLAGHEPYPALAIDRHWTMVAANSALARLIAAADAALLQPPVNVLRLSLHPGAGAAHRQSTRVARASAGPAAPPDRGLGRSRPGRPAARAGRLSGADQPATGRHPTGHDSPACWCPCSSPRRPARSPSSARPPSSARRSTSRCRSWRWSVLPRRRRHRRRTAEHGRSKC